MLQPISHVLASRRIILASGSPRRKQILQNCGLKFEVIPSQYEENLDPANYSHTSRFVVETAYHKTMEVVNRLVADPVKPDLVIGADTMVTMDGVIYGKPKTEEEAFKMLSLFSGRSHIVYTGVVLWTPSSIVKFHEGTEVKMTSLTPEIIKGYVETGEPMDKAGGYGIQEKGGTLVESVHGDYFNVVGFPLHRFCKEILNLLSEKR